MSGMVCSLQRKLLRYYAHHRCQPWLHSIQNASIEFDKEKGGRKKKHGAPDAARLCPEALFSQPLTKGADKSSFYDTRFDAMTLIHLGFFVLFSFFILKNKRRMSSMMCARWCWLRTWWERSRNVLGEGWRTKRFDSMGWGKKAPSIINRHQLQREIDLMCFDGRATI